MSQFAAGHAHEHDAPHVAARAQFDPAAATLKGGATLSTALGFVGVLGLVVTGIGAYSTGGEEAVRHAMAAYHVGVMYCLGLALGSLGLVMILQQFNAGWSAVPRRIAEIISSLIPVCFVLFLPTIILEVFVFHGRLFEWMRPDAAATDMVLHEKVGFLNPVRWFVTTLVYFILWTILATSLFKLSRKQDETGDQWLTAKARKISSIGLLLFALSIAFASFDWMMSLDHHWFSTMFGVQWFASSMLGTVSFIAGTLCVLMIRGRLKGIVTSEHLHDMGKLMLSFTIFWAYISFSQYFLIWYSGIPEETAWFNVRTSHGWDRVFWILAYGQFCIPFLVLLFRPVKRNPRILLPVAIWILLVLGVHYCFIIRPVVHEVPIGRHVWLDFFGWLGPVCVFLAFVVKRMGSTPLIPLKDPRLQEALAHKNYV